MLTQLLQQTKTLENRIQKKHEFIVTHLIRPAIMMDPLQEDGGQRELIKRELQAIKDLEERVVEVKRAIHAANLYEMLTVDKETRTVHDWLVWRNDVMNPRTQRIRDMLQKIGAYRTKADQARAKVVEDTKDSDKHDLLVNLSERSLTVELEHIETVNGELDSALSIFNATHDVDIEELAE